MKVIDIESTCPECGHSFYMPCAGCCADGTYKARLAAKKAQHGQQEWEGLDVEYAYNRHKSFVTDKSSDDVSMRQDCTFIIRGDFSDCAHAGGGRGAPLSDWCKPCLVNALTTCRDALTTTTRERDEAVAEKYEHLYGCRRCVDVLRQAGCKCERPLLGHRPGVGPRCRLCNVETPVVGRLEEALRAGLSRLTLARASMRAAVKHKDFAHVEAWLLAAEENGWINEAAAALGGEGHNDEC